MIMVVIRVIMGTAETKTIQGGIGVRNRYGTTKAARNGAGTKTRNETSI